MVSATSHHTSLFDPDTSDSINRDGHTSGEIGELRLVRGLWPLLPTWVEDGQVRVNATGHMLRSIRERGAPPQDVQASPLESRSSPSADGVDAPSPTITELARTLTSGPSSEAIPPARSLTIRARLGRIRTALSRGAGRVRRVIDRVRFRSRTQE
ncbi:unnamed protein product [Peniophora sp. CBMAI 1063]|nr:unnamed protein product [Peniophora sp. CBMAI 1063]